MPKKKSIIDRLLEMLHCKNDDELLEKLNIYGVIHQPQVSRWRTNGFAKSTEILMELMLVEHELLLDEIDRLKKSCNK